MKEELIVIEKEKMRDIMKMILSLKLQVVQLERIVKEAKMEILK